MRNALDAAVDGRYNTQYGIRPTPTTIDHDSPLNVGPSENTRLPIPMECDWNPYSAPTWTGRVLSSIGRMVTNDPPLRGYGPLIQKLRLDAAFQPRTPRLLTTLKNKAVRYMADFDTSTWLQEDITNAVIASSMIAYAGTSKDHFFARVMESSDFNKAAGRMTAFA